MLPASPPTFNIQIAQDVAFEQECVALFANFLHVLGVPKSVGAIYGLLFASSEALCFAQIVERLDVSKGSVSQGLAFLRQSGAVKVVEIIGDRREFFEPELALRQLANGLIQEKVRPLAYETRMAVAKLRRQTADKYGERQKFQLDRIKQLEIWHRQLSRVLPVVQTILRVSRP